MAGRQGGCGALVRRVAILALCAWSMHPAVAATPLVAQGAAGLVAQPLNEAAKPVKQAQPEGAPAAADPAPAEAAPQEKPSLTASLIKYGPSYVLMVLLVGLGAAIACAPRTGALVQPEAGKGKSPSKK